MIITAMSFLISAMASAPAKFDVKTELLLNGKVIANPRVVALAGEEAEIHVGRGPDNFKMKILAVPTDVKNGELKLDIDLMYKSADRTIHSQPQVYAKAGQEALMTLEESTKAEKVQLRILAKPTP